MAAHVGGIDGGDSGGSGRVSRAGAITCLLGWKRRADSRGGTEVLVSGVGVIMALLWKTVGPLRL